jgi:phospholipid/cholesterol/gamma-HCH transport system substrate-binding protein
MRPFLRETPAIIKNQLRPFTRVATPVVKEIRPAAAAFADATPDLTTSFGILNAFLNGLAYNPPGRAEGYMFYLAWLNHVTNSLFSTQDGEGPVRRGVLAVECADLTGVNGLRRNTNLATLKRYLSVWLLTQLVNAPPNEACTRANLPGGD